MSKLMQILLFGLMLGWVGTADAKEKPNATAISLEEYIRAAKANRPSMETSEGSLYSEIGVNAHLFNDFKARQLNDILTIRVTENTVAESTANSTTGRKSAMAATAPNLFGLEKHISTLPNLVSTSGDTSFKGNGTTQRSGTFSAFLTARVREVLPNGDLVVEGIKEIKINNERQLLTLFGVVRPKDVGPDNVVLSTQVANMQVYLEGKGLVSDNIKPGLLFRILSKVWPL